MLYVSVLFFLVVKRCNGRNVIFLLVYFRNKHNTEQHTAQTKREISLHNQKSQSLPNISHLYSSAYKQLGQVKQYYYIGKLFQFYNPQISNHIFICFVNILNSLGNWARDEVLKEKQSNMLSRAFKKEDKNSH